MGPNLITLVVAARTMEGLRRRVGLAVGVVSSEGLEGTVVVVPDEDEEEDSLLLAALAGLDLSFFDGLGGGL